MKKLRARREARRSRPTTASDKVKLASGTLLTVDNQIDPATGTVKLKAQFANEDDALFPNQFVNVRMLLDMQRDATVVPTAAMQRGTQGTFVYVVKADKTVTLRPVKLGPSEGDDVVVESGLAPGEHVVVDGADQLREGAKVEVTRRPGASRRRTAKRRAGAPQTARRQRRRAAPKCTAPMNPSRLFILRPVATIAAHGRHPAGGHRRLSRSCRSRRCRRSITRRSRS